jgi:hypothetical protein
MQMKLSNTKKKELEEMSSSFDNKLYKVGKLST